MKAKHDNKKHKKSTSGSALEKAMRSSGILLPESDDEFESFNKQYGSTQMEFPADLETPEFLTENFLYPIVISEVFDSASVAEESQFTYAARNGNEKLPVHILEKMRLVKEAKSRSKKSC